MTNMDNMQQSLDTFTNTFQSTVISSLTKQGEPFASYAPFVKVEDHYYFIISKIAKHYENMLNHPKISIFFITDESQTQQIFFRKRLSYLVNTMFIEQDTIKQAFIDRFGDFVKRLFMMDFVMVKCEIINGKYIIGPGQAFEVDQHQKIIKVMTSTEGKGHSMHK